MHSVLVPWMVAPGLEANQDGGAVGNGRESGLGSHPLAPSCVTWSTLAHTLAARGLLGQRREQSSLPIRLWRGPCKAREGEPHKCSGTRLLSPLGQTGPRIERAGRQGRHCHTIHQWSQTCSQRQPLVSAERMSLHCHHKDGLQEMLSHNRQLLANVTRQEQGQCWAVWCQVLLSSTL